MNNIKLYEVGGCIRDEILGLRSKDVDFAVEAESFDEMRQYLKDEDFDIFLETPEFLTIRARPPAGSVLRERTNGADFVLCRKDSVGSDGRRPDSVEVGDIYDDLARRDFTVNAVGREVGSRQFLDPHGGIADMNDRVLRFVGDPMARIREDGLRVIRGLRFMVTKGFDMEPATRAAILSEEAAECLKGVADQRVGDELSLMFRHDTIGSIAVVADLPFHLQFAIFRGKLHLDATRRQGKLPFDDPEEVP